MTAERLRGTHDGRVVREALIDGAWVEVPDDGPAEVDAAVEAVMAVPIRRGPGRPRKS